jgi:hypothetical protein
MGRNGKELFPGMVNMKDMEMHSCLLFQERRMPEKEVTEDI